MAACGGGGGPSKDGYNWRKYGILIIGGSMTIGAREVRERREMHRLNVRI
jgi:hypothetical protein